MMPRPAHPTPGMGPPASTHSTPSSARRTTSSSVGVPPARMRSSTVGTCVPPGCSAVESDLGSQPICMTVWPRPARAAARLQVVVDFPMPPLPYIASRYIASPFPLNTQKRAGRPPAFPPALYDCKACVRRPLCGGARCAQGDALVLQSARSPGNGIRSCPIRPLQKARGPCGIARAALIRGVWLPAPGRLLQHEVVAVEVDRAVFVQA